MFIYAILGINLFADVKLQTHINERANFQSLLGALNILIRCALGQDWTYFMLELSNTTIPGCRVISQLLVC
jgi:Ion transport protein.